MQLTNLKRHLLWHWLRKIISVSVSIYQSNCLLLCVCFTSFSFVIVRLFLLSYASNWLHSTIHFQNGFQCRPKPKSKEKKKTTTNKMNNKNHFHSISKHLTNYITHISFEKSNLKVILELYLLQSKIALEWRKMSTMLRNIRKIPYGWLNLNDR